MPLARAVFAGLSPCLLLLHHCLGDRQHDLALVGRGPAVAGAAGFQQPHSTRLKACPWRRSLLIVDVLVAFLSVAENGFSCGSPYMERSGGSVPHVCRGWTGAC